MGQKQQVIGKICKIFVYIWSPDLDGLAHARVAYKVSISLKLGWVQLDKVTCE
jgi:hypothetical protein